MNISDQYLIDMDLIGLNGHEKDILRKAMCAGKIKTVSLVDENNKKKAYMTLDSFTNFLGLNPSEIEVSKRNKIENKINSILRRSKI
ncbi:Uncharacterised protein [Campylobacter hyointestinalis subsp. hyointestinalis]|uniref:Uncharacterized protein n=1 Tax=Campylobacter hyointestinalis subsp. hyointestinalis TaxID=91352 RepID=A0A0S4SWP3_CAMHY|nr:hypothetical protein [Campylobacter hyointestinalis]CUU89953.1 Uncharacterised protein [Campylobacter hyointestinalis subsp. hyointestinalis]